MSMSQEQDNTVDTTVEEQTSQETVEETTQTTDTVSKEEYEKVLETNKQLYARLKKAETNEKPKTDEVEETTHSQLGDIDTVEFFAKGGDREAYQKLQMVMKATGKSFSEAQEDELYTAWKSTKDAERRKEQAQVGAGKGGVRREAPKANMTEDEHRAMWAGKFKK